MPTLTRVSMAPQRFMLGIQAMIKAVPFPVFTAALIMVAGCGEPNSVTTDTADQADAEPGNLGSGSEVGQAVPDASPQELTVASKSFSTAGLPMSDHAVLVHFNYASSQLDDLHQLETLLESVIEATGVGEYDGHEIAVDLSDGVLYMYGPDADALFAAVQGTLVKADCLQDAKATLRYGPPEDGVREKVIELDDQ